MLIDHGNVLLNGKKKFFYKVKPFFNLLGYFLAGGDFQIGLPRMQFLVFSPEKKA